VPREYLAQAAYAAFVPAPRAEVNSDFPRFLSLNVDRSRFQTHRVAMKQPSKTRHRHQTLDAGRLYFHDHLGPYRAVMTLVVPVVAALIRAVLIVMLPPLLSAMRWPDECALVACHADPAGRGML